MGGIIGATVKYQSPFEVKKEDDDKPADQTVDQTATSTVKKKTLNNDQYYATGSTSGCSFYEDYYVKYTIHLFNGRLILTRWKRSGSYWSRDSNEMEAGLKCVGACSSLNGITQKAWWGEGFEYNYTYLADFAPQNGYAVCFTTNDREQKYMRVFTEDYTLNSMSGSLEPVTIQYQLY